MSDIKQNIKVKADTGSAERDMKKLGNTMRNSFITGQLAAQALTKALGVMTEVLGDGIKSALEMHETMRDQAIAFRAAGFEINRNTELMEAQSTLLERLTGIGQEQIRTLQTLAVNLGVQEDRITDVVKASIAYSKAMKVDVRTAMTALIKTGTGFVDRTLKQIVEIDNLTEAQLRNGDAIDVINEKYGTFIEEGSKGLTGELSQLKTAFENTSKAVGIALTNAELFRLAVVALTNAMFNLQKAAEGAASAGFIASIMDPVLGQKSAEALRGLEELQLRRAQLLKELEDADQFGAPSAIARPGLDNEFSPALGAGDSLLRGGSRPGVADKKTKSKEEEIPLPSLVPIPEVEEQHARILELEEMFGVQSVEGFQRRTDQRVAMEIAANEKIAASHKKTQENIQLVASVASSALTAGVMQWVETGEFAAGSMVKNMVAAIGQILFARGVSDVAMGIATSVTLGSFGAGVPQMRQGFVEMGLGTAMMAGSKMFGGGGARGSSGGGGGGGSRGGGGGSIGGGGGSIGGGGGDITFGAPMGQTRVREEKTKETQIVVNINGPTFATESEIGMAIEKARRAAIENGVLG